MNAKEAAVALDNIGNTPAPAPVKAEPAVTVDAPVKIRRKKLVNGAWQEVEVELPPGTDVSNPVVDTDHIEPPTDADVKAGRATPQQQAELQKMKEARAAKEAVEAEVAEEEEEEAEDDGFGDEDEDEEDAEVEDAEVPVHADPGPARAATSVRVEAPEAPVAPAPQPGLQPVTTPEVEQMMDLLRRTGEAQGKRMTNVTTACRNFATWLASRGLTLTTAPATAMSDWVRSTYENPGTRNVNANFVKGALTMLAQAGVPVTRQEWKPDIVPHKPKPPKPVAAPAHAAAVKTPEGLDADLRFFGEKLGLGPADQIDLNQAFVQTGTDGITRQVTMREYIMASITSVPTAPQQAVANPAAVPAGQPIPIPPAPVAAPKRGVAPGTPIATVHGQVVTAPAPVQAPMAARGGARRLNVGVGADGLPVGGKFKFSRKATGMDIGMVPGSLIGFGAPVPASTVAVYPTVDEWIQVNLLNAPNLRHLAGTDVTIVVERLDDRGQPMRLPEEFYYTVPGVPGQYPSPMHAGPQWQQAPQQAPQPQLPSANERLLDFLLAQNADLQKQARETMAGARNDPSAMMIVMQMQQQAADIARKVEETKAKIEAERAAPKPQPRPAYMGGLGGAGMGPMGPGGEPYGSPFGAFGFRPPMPALAADEGKDAMAELARTVIEKSFDKPAPVPAPAPPDPLAHPLVGQMFAAVMAPKQTGPDPMWMEMLRAEKEKNARLEDKLDRLMEKLSSPEKTSEMDKAMGMIDKLLVLREKVEPPQSTPGMTDVLMNLVNQLPDIVPPIMAAQVKAPQLPAHVPAPAPAPRAQPMPRPQPAPRTTADGRPALPDAARQSLVALKDAQSDQQVADSIFGMVRACMTDPAWRPLTVQFHEQFSAAMTRADLRKLVVESLTAATAVKLAANTAVVDKAADVLFRNYSQIYAATHAGQQKALPAEAAPAPAPVQAPVQAPVVAKPVAPVQPRRPQPVPELIGEDDPVEITPRAMAQNNFAPKNGEEPVRVTSEMPPADPKLVTV